MVGGLEDAIYVYKSEAQLQAKCVDWYRNEWHLNIESLWATFNEGLNTGGKISMGMVAGVPDLLLRDERGLIGIEMKLRGKSHNVKHLRKQASWINTVCDDGGFCDNFEQFKRIIQGESAWYKTESVLYWLNNVKSSSVIWDNKNFNVHLF